MKPISILLFALFAVLAVPATAQQPIKINDLVNETQKQAEAANAMTVVWWIPAEFWQATMAANQATSEEANQLLAVLRPYLLLAVVDGKIGPLGGVTYKSEQTIRSELKVVDSKGRSYSPLPEDQISADAKNLVQMMRPVLSNVLGPMGENMRFYLFPAADGSGAEIANAKGERGFEVQLGEQRFRWRLPLGSVLPPKVCPEDGEVFSGAWSYCPWHGSKLKPAAAPVPASKSEQRPEGSNGRG